MTSTYLSRKDAADYLKSLGLPYSKATLQKLASVGGGPVYRRFGNRAVYTTGDLNTWVEEKLSPPLSSSVEG